MFFIYGFCDSCNFFLLYEYKWIHCLSIVTARRTCPSPLKSQSGKQNEVNTDSLSCWKAHCLVIHHLILLKQVKYEHFWTYLVKYYKKQQWYLKGSKPSCPISVFFYSSVFILVCCLVSMGYCSLYIIIALYTALNEQLAHL